MRYEKAFYFWACATVLCMALIFVFSSMNSDASSALSEPMTMKLFGSLGFETLLRKSAHFLVFSLLGFLAANSFKYLVLEKKAYCFALAFASLYAATDEIHQLFVPGRSCELRDWAIDTAGALLGVCFAFLLNRWIIMRKRRKMAGA